MDVWHGHPASVAMGSQQAVAVRLCRSDASEQPSLPANPSGDALPDLVSPFAPAKERSFAARKTTLSLVVLPDAHAESVQVDILTLLGLAESAAVDAESQIDPKTGWLPGMVVAVSVGVAFK